MGLGLRSILIQICVKKQLQKFWLSFRAKFGCTKMKGLISISYEQNQPHRMAVHKNENLKYKEL